MASETQESIYRWMAETFPGMAPKSPRKAIRALEEMVELCLAAGASAKEIDGAVCRSLHAAGFSRYHQIDGWNNDGVAHADKIPAEAADVLIVLYGVAGMRGFDLHAEVDRKMAINRARRWKANGDGTGYHIKEG